MDKTTSLKPNQITSLHLYELAHSAPLSPLNPVYTKLLTNYNNEKSINLPSSLDYKICTNCGTLLIPGLNVTIRIIFPKSKSKSAKTTTKAKISANKINVSTNLNSDHENSPSLSELPQPNSSRYLQIKCNNCKFKIKDFSLINRLNKAAFTAEWTPESTNKVSDKVTKPVNKAKDRAKKRKQNSLSTMLQNKKKQSNNGLNSLNLMDFLGS